MVFIALFGLGVMILAIATVVTELWGEPLLDITGMARRVPVWMAWVGVILALGGGISLLRMSVGWLYRVARGRVPRVQPTTRRAPAKNRRRPTSTT